MTLALTPLRGIQRPRITSCPVGNDAAGLEAIELAESAGLYLDPWQQFVLRQALRETPDGRWAAFEVGLVVPRQNGKGSLLESRELAGLFLLDEQLILHSAHEFKTAAEGFRRIMFLIENCPDLDRQVKKVTRSHGDEGVELKTGQRLRFVARTGGSGRGFSGDCVIFDEAYNLDGRAMGALLPTLSARPNPQLWYASSAGKPESEQLQAVRRRGLDGGPGLAYFEWSAPDDAPHEDRGAWAQANPALGIRITEEFISRELNALPPAEFARERLGIWDDQAAETIFPAGKWESLEDRSASLLGVPMFGIEAPEDRAWAAIGAVGRGSHEGITLDVVQYDRGLKWVVPRMLELLDSNPGSLVGIRPSSPAASLIPEFPEDRVVKLSQQQFAQACGDLYDAVVEGLVRHLGQRALDESVRRARKRSSADAFVWDARKSAWDISPLSALTVAAWMHKAYAPVDILSAVW